MDHCAELAEMDGVRRVQLLPLPRQWTSPLGRGGIYRSAECYYPREPEHPDRQAGGELQTVWPVTRRADLFADCDAMGRFAQQRSPCRRRVAPAGGQKTVVQTDSSRFDWTVKLAGSSPRCH